MAAKLLTLLKRVPSLLIAVFFTYVFVASGVVVTVLSLLLLFLWPVAATTYRRITSGLAYTVLGRMLKDPYCREATKLPLYFQRLCGSVLTMQISGFTRLVKQKLTTYLAKTSRL